MEHTEEPKDLTVILHDHARVTLFAPAPETVITNPFRRTGSERSMAR
jgi:hypothetical protein